MCAFFSGFCGFQKKFEKIPGLAVFTTKETEAQRGSDLSKITQHMRAGQGLEVTISGEPLSVCNRTWLGGGRGRKERRDQVSPGSLVPARPPDLGVGSVWVPRSGCRFPEVPGGRGKERTQPGRAPTAPSGHSRVPCERASREARNTARTGTPGESESGMGVGRSPFIHCSQRLLFGEMGGPSSLQDAAAGLSGGGVVSGLCGSHTPSPCHSGECWPQRARPCLGIVRWCLFSFRVLQGN